jgi:hypothetical protein
VAAAPPDLSPVPPPPGLTVVLSVTNAESLQRAVKEIVGESFPIVQQITPNAAAQIFLGTALSDVIDLSKPVRLAFLDHQETFAASFAIASIDDAKKNLAEDFELAHRDGDVLALTPHKGDADASKLRCEIRPAAGPTPYLLVCSSHLPALRALAPYLARTVAAEPAKVDAQLRVFPSALGALVQPVAPTASANERMGTEWGNDALRDLGVLSFDVSAREGSVDAALEGDFVGSKSPLTRIAANYTRGTTEPPALFWHLPADALGAAYAGGSPAADLEPIRESLLSSLTTDARNDGASDAIVTLEEKTFRSTLFTGGPIAVAYGFDLAGATAAITGATVKKPLARAPLHGWYMVGLNEPFSRWDQAFRDAIALDRMPWKSTHEAKRKDNKEPTIVHIDELPLGEAKGFSHASHFAFREYPVDDSKKKAKKGARPISTFHVFVVEDGERTFLGLGENEAQVLGKVKVAVAGAPGTVLAGRSDLQALHRPTSFAGFVTPALVDALRAPSDPTDPLQARTLLDRITGGRDAETLPVTFVAFAPEGHAERFELDVSAPTGAVKLLLSRAK